MPNANAQMISNGAEKIKNDAVSSVASQRLFINITGMVTETISRINSAVGTYVTDSTIDKNKKR